MVNSQYSKALLHLINRYYISFLLMFFCRLLSDQLAQNMLCSINMTDCLRQYLAVLLKGKALIEANPSLLCSAAVERVFSTAGEIYTLPK